MKLKAVAAAVLCCGSTLAVAGTMGDVVTSAPRFYIGAEGGGSISLRSGFHQDLLANTDTFNIVPFNSDWDKDIGLGGFGGVLVGYQYNPNVAVQFTYDYRTGFEYNLHANYGMSPDNPGVDYFEDHIYTLDDINVQTFLFDLYLKPTVNWGGFVPYVKGGIGIGYNEMPILRDVDLPFKPNTAAFDNRFRSNTETSFAWDAGVGADYFFNEKISIGMGYRFVDAGKLSTANVNDDAVSGVNNISVAPFITNHLYFNEFVASVAYHFDYA